MLQRKNRFHFTSLGCARNLVDSEVMIGLLLKKGYEITPEMEEADYLVINTCGFLESSRQEGLDVIGQCFERKKGEAKVVVAGCMVQKHRSLLEENYPDIHYYLGSGDVEKIVTAIEATEAGEGVTDAKSYLEWGEVPRFVSTPKHYAYLKIAEGCKKRCAFCIIPTIKGPLKSKGVEQVLKEFNALLNQGVFEIVLIAQDLGDYGKDRLEKQGLHRLLKEMLKVDRPFWLRLLYLYPDEIDDELIALLKSDPRIVPYLDMPIQHINDEVLKRMHRKTSKGEIISIIEKLRKEIPEISIRTSVMVGFPGETEEQFQELCTFLEEHPIDHLGTFSFSLEKEAFAAKYEDQIPESVKEKRLKKLTKLQSRLIDKQNRRYIGKTIDVMVEGFHPESEHLLRGRHAGQCPDIDGMVILNDWQGVTEFHRLYKVEITDVAGPDLIGRALVPVKKKRDRLALC